MKPEDEKIYLLAGKKIGYSEGVSAFVDRFLSWLYEEKDKGRMEFGFVELGLKVYSLLSDLASIKKTLICLVPGQLIQAGDQIIGVGHDETAISKLLADGDLLIYASSFSTEEEIVEALLQMLPEGLRAIIYQDRCKLSINELGGIVIAPGWQAGEVARKLNWASESYRIGGSGKVAFQLGDIKGGKRAVEIV